MNINSGILAPVKSNQLADRFFSKRVKRKNRKKAKKWLKRLNNAVTTTSVRKTLSRISKKRESVPYSISQRETPPREKMNTIQRPINTPVISKRAVSSNSKRFKSATLALCQSQKMIIPSKKKFCYKKRNQGESLDPQPN